MMEDPLEIKEAVPDKEITPGEASEEDPVVVDLAAEESNVTSIEEEAELFSRCGSVPLVVEDVEEVEAPAKTLEK